MEGSLPDFVVPPLVKQQYAFNAVFSKSTNAAREHLARVIEGESGGGRVTIGPIGSQYSWPLAANGSHTTITRDGR